jgi:hypothetical protein
MLQGLPEQVVARVEVVGGGAERHPRLLGDRPVGHRLAPVAPDDA